MRSALARVVALAVVLASGCNAPPAVSTTVAASSSEVRVGLTEWDISIGATAIPADAATLVVTNAGTTAHDMRVTAVGGDIAGSRLLQPGEQQTVTFNAPEGADLRLWCTVPGHGAQGMQTTIAVIDRTLHQ